MKPLSVISLLLILAVVPLSVTASSGQTELIDRTAEHECYRLEQRGSRYCQLVMFPPVPLR